MKNELGYYPRPQMSGDRYELAVLGIIGDLLRLEGDKLDVAAAAAAADQAAQKIHDYYCKAYPDEDQRYDLRRDDDHGASSMTNAICSHVWEMAL